ncbi:glycoside hydrolase family 3 C-terminal domain-containing protein [Micromonospora sp. CB01531]|uniref:glycoside hydrolase family 3 C-terminal domain-containing protein n=1 Tax=Micromonospora sp. CB01531 TaxID=1718947 RepID=UPI0013011D74|nr:glycoside hydrolase family 3 C-terminal domain-containing protein [Micromonospora sp. CB01531]
MPDLATVVGAGSARVRSRNRKDSSHRAAIVVVLINILLACHCPQGSSASPVSSCPAGTASTRSTAALAGAADVLFGGYAPTGKLPMTWMNSVGQQPINAGDGQVPLFPQAFGLTY